jgi:hypothetical protein
MTDETTKAVNQAYMEKVIVETVSVRDQFAMAALPGLIGRVGRPNTVMKSMTDVAKVAYELADAMLAARK